MEEHRRLKNLIILILFGIALSPGVLYAQTTDISTVTPTDAYVNVTTIYTIEFTTATALNSVSDEIVITFPAGFDASGAGVDGAGTITQSGTDPQINAGESNATTVVLDIQAVEPAGIQTIVLTGIDNPAAAQSNISVDVSTRLDNNTPVDGDDPTPVQFSISGTLTLAAGAAPITANALTILDGIGGVNIELTTFSLTAGAENFPIDTIRITPTFTGMTTAEISQIDIYYDDGAGGGVAGDGIINGTESSIAQAAVDDQNSGNSVPIEINYTQNTGTDNFIVVAAFTAGVNPNDQVRLDVDAAAQIVTGSGSISGLQAAASGAAITGYTHTVTGAVDITGTSFTNPGVSDTGTVTITFDTRTDLTDGTEEMVITFPGNFDLSITSVDATTVTVSGVDPTINAGETAGQVITLTIGAAENSGTHTIILADVINPNTAQNDISLDVITQTASNEQIDGDDATPATFDIVGTLKLEPAAVPIDTNVLKQASRTGGTSLVLTTFKMTAAGENAPIDSIALIPRFGGMTPAEISNLDIYKDDDNDGVLDGGELPITDAAKDENGSNNPVMFYINPTHTQNVGSNNFLVTADIAGTVSANDSIRIDIDSTAHWTFGNGPVTGSPVQGIGNSLWGWVHTVTDTLDVTHISLSNPGISSAGLDTLIFTTLTDLVLGDEIVVTYPAGFNAAAATVDAAGTVTPSGTDPVKNAGKSNATNVVLTVQNAETAGAFTVVLNNVTNPAAIQNDISADVITRTGANDLIDAVDSTPDTFDVVATLTLGAAATVIDTNVLKQKHLDGVTNEIFTTFQLTAAGEDVPIDTMILTPAFSGLVTGELSNLDIYLDNNGDGKINGADASLSGSPVDDNGSGNPVKIPTPAYTQSGTSNFIAIASLTNAVTASDWLHIDVNQAADFIIQPGAVTSYAEKIGAQITGWRHTVSDSINLTSVSASNPGVSRTGTYTIAFTTMTNLAVNDQIVVVFPANYDASGTTVNATTTTPSGSDPVLFSANATTVVVRAPTTYTSGAFSLVLNNIINPSNVLDETSTTVYTQTNASDLIDREDTTPATYDVVATLTLEIAIAPIDTNVLKLKHLIGGTDLVFTTFKLTAAGENVPVTQFSSTPTFAGMVTGEVSNMGMYLDDGAGGGTADDGIINGTETFVSGTGSQDDGGTGNPVHFASTYTQNAATSSNFVTVATIANSVTVNDSFRLDIDYTEFSVNVGPITGSAAEIVGPVLSGFQHFVSDTANVVSVSSSNTGVSRTSSYTVVFNTTTNLAFDYEIVIKFPTGFDASGFTVNASTTTPSGVDPTKNAGETDALNAVLDMAAFESAGAFSITIDNVINPGTVQNDISVEIHTRSDNNDLIDKIDTSLPTFDVGATLTLAAATTPIDTIKLKQTEGNGAVQRELTSFKLSTAGENVPITSIQITPHLTGITTGEISNLDIYLDNGAGGGIASNGVIDGTESSIATGAVDDAGSGNPVTVTLSSFTQTPGDLNYIVTADLASTISANDDIRIDIDAAANISVGNGPVTDIPAENIGGALTGFTHTVTDTARVTNVTVQTPGIGQTSRYDITFTTKTNLVNGNEEIVMIFPGAINPQTASVNNAVTATVSGTDPVISGESAGQDLVFTIQAVENAGTHVISLDNITNPGTVQDDIQIRIYTRTSGNELLDAPAISNTTFDIVGTLTLAAADAPIGTNSLKQTQTNGAVQQELTTFKLTAAGETIAVNSLKVTSVFSGMTSGEITSIDIIRDNGSGGGTADNGLIDGGESSIVSSTVNAGASGAALTISMPPFNQPVGSENYIVAANISTAVSANDQLQIDVNAATDITLGGGGTTNSPGQTFGALISGHTHTVTDSIYVSSVRFSSPSIGATATDTIEFTTSTDLVPTDEIVMTFPAALNVSAAALDAATLTPSTTDPPIDAGKTAGQTIVLDINANETAGTFSIVLNNIVNPGAVQDDLTVSVFTRSASEELIDQAEDTPAPFDVVGTVSLSAASSPIDSNTLASTEGTGGLNKAMTAFQLTAAGENYTINTMSVTPYFSGMTTAELYDIDLYLDNGAGGGTASNGKIDGTEFSILTAKVNDSGSGNPVTLTLNSHVLPVGSYDYILTASFTSAITANSTIRFDTNDSTDIVTSSGSVTGASAVESGNIITGYTHIVGSSVIVDDVTLEKSGYAEQGNVLITLTTKTNLDNIGDEIVITFPAGFGLTNVGVDASTVTQSGTDPTLNAGETSGQAVVLDVQAAENAGTQYIVLSGVKNPAVLQNDISLNVSTRLDNDNPIDGEDGDPVVFDVTGIIRLDDGDSVIAINNLGSLAEIGGTDIPMTTFRLTSILEGFTLDSIRIKPVFNGMLPSELYDLNIYLDDGAGGGTAANAKVDGSESPITQSAINDNESGNAVTFIIPSHTLPVDSQNYIITASFENTVDPDDSIRIMIDSTMIFTSGGSVTGSPAYVRGDSISGHMHIVDTRFNVNSISLTRPGIGDTSDIIIELRTTIPLPAAGDEIVIVFPDTLDISQIVLDAATETPSGIDPTIDPVKSVGQQLVLNVGAPEPSGIYTIKFNNIFNPDSIAKDVTCIVTTRQDDGTILAEEDETPDLFSVVGKVYLREGTTPIQDNRIEPIAQTGGTQIPLTTFNLQASGEAAVIDTVWVRPVFDPFESSNISNINIFLDDGSGTGGIAGNGNIDGDESSVAITSVDERGDNERIPIAISGQTLANLESRNYIITADFTSAMQAQDQINMNIDSSYSSIIGTGVRTEAPIYGVGGSITGYIHTVPGLKLRDLADTTITEARILEFTVSSPFTNVPGRVFSVKSLPTRANFNTQTGDFYWTPDLTQAGTYTIQFIVTAGGETDTEYMRITVSDVNILTDLVHADSSYFRPGQTDTVQSKETGIYTGHKVRSLSSTVFSPRYVIVQSPGNKLTEEEIYDHPSAVEFLVMDYEEGFTFADSLRLTLEYKEFEIRNNELNMRIHQWDPDKRLWHRLTNYQRIDTLQNTVTVRVNHFSIFSIIEASDTLQTTILSSGWNMISLPMEPAGENNPQALFGDNIKHFKTETNNSNIYGYTESLNAWAVPTALHSGLGYVLFGYYPPYGPNSFNINISGVELTGDITHTLSRTGSNGWHLLGNPYAVDINWDNDITREEGINGTFYRWTGEFYDFYPGGELTQSIDPWQGFWMRTTKNNAEITFSYPGAGKETKQSPSPVFDWRMQIEAESGANRDPYNFIGTKANADTAYDQYDVFELVPLNREFLSLYFPHPEWKTNAGNFTQDIRTDIPATWNMSVATNSNADHVILRWNVPDSLRAYCRIQLHIPGSKETVNMFQENIFAYDIHPSSGKRAEGTMITNPDPSAFLGKLAAGDVIIHEFSISVSPVTIENTDNAAVIPTEYYLRQNYPNPFNPTTVIEYGLPEAGNVSLHIYNILGQRIRSLVHSQQEPGQYKIVWNGKNNVESDCGSGVYFYRLSVNQFHQIRKLTLLR